MEAPAADFEACVPAIPFLRALSAPDLDRLRAYASCRRVTRGTPIWSEGGPSTAFTFLAGGSVKLVKAGEGGREAIVDLPQAGELLCASVVCAFAPYCCSALAGGEATLVSIPRRDLLELVERSPDASRAFLREVTLRGMRLGGRIGELSSGQVERRLVTLLLRLAEQVGTPRADGSIWIPLSLSRQDLADLCATTLESAIRSMSKLARQGLVKSVARGFVVPNRPRLEALLRSPARARGC
jgi:CRP-like cAMP-binding protein